MTDWTMQSMADDRQLLSMRLSAFVSPLAAKALAQKIGCDVRTAENIKKGHWPIARHWLGLVAAFGRDVTEAVFHPDEAVERLTREVAEHEQQLAAARSKLRLVEQEAPRPLPRLAQVPRRLE